MIGNAHLDPVWLWPWQEGLDEALATFRSAADRCDEYPEFIFTKGEAWAYEQVAEIDPKLFARVRRLIEEGRWIVPSPQYIQPDANLITIHGWDRQLTRGRRYFKETFGLEPKCGYNVDSFGHPATLPDILNRHGCRYYVFHRPNPKQMTLPAQTFRWRGPKGGEVIGHRIIPVYVTRSDELYGQIRLALDSCDPSLGHVMCFYGVGNHGGGPTKGNIEYILGNKHAFAGAVLKFSDPETYFQALESKRDQLPVHEGELQHTFPGCYSVMHGIKQTQYLGEHRLQRAAEFLQSFTANGKADQEEEALLQKAWDDLLFTQFHDILAGTSIPSAWPSVMAMQGRALITAEEVITRTTRKWARNHLPPVNEQQIAIFNPDGKAFEGLLETEPFLDFDPWGERWICGMDGRPIPFQRIQPEACIMLANRILLPARIPARDTLQIMVKDGPSPGGTAMPEEIATAAGDRLENRFLKVACGPGGIRSIRFQDREMLGKEGIKLHLRVDNTDTWTFLHDRFEEPVETVLDSLREWRVEETGPLRARLRGEGGLGNSRVRWTVSLPFDAPCLSIRLEVNFCERYRALQLPVALAFAPEKRLDGIAGGWLSRQAGPWEFPFQKGSLVLGKEDRIGLVTGDFWSLSQNGPHWQFTLLRSPRMAWGGQDAEIFGGREEIAENGRHEFWFDLWFGKELGTDCLETLNRRKIGPPVVFSRYEGMDRPAWGNNPPRVLWTGAEQRARADGQMQHLRDSGEMSVEGT